MISKTFSAISIELPLFVMKILIVDDDVFNVSSSGRKKYAKPTEIIGGLSICIQLTQTLLHEDRF